MPDVQPDMERFADALIAMAQAADCLQQIETELTGVLPLIAESARIRGFLADPTIRTEGKRKAVAEVVGDGVHPALLCFLCFLVDEHQLTRMDDIAESFFEKVSGMREEASGELVSAVPLKGEKVALIEEETGRMLGRKVSLRTRVDPGLLGGLYVRVGDFVIDGTLDRQLDTLRQTLLD